MKAMVIGLKPEYLYPGNLREWQKNNTNYAANLGACFISNSLIKQFSADYIDDFSNIPLLQNKYDVCILALATHLHPYRDVSYYVDIVEKLGIKTILISSGIKDYEQNISLNYKFHPSVTRLLQIASESSQWLGVRGHYSAAVMRANGFKNVVPIGCPSVYWGMKDNLVINPSNSIKNLLIVYHSSLAMNCLDFIKGHKLIGQDYEDEPLFTDSLAEDTELLSYLDSIYSVDEELKEKIFTQINEHGVFYRSFKKWFDEIGKHDFVVGTRLHGCLSAIVQGIPALLVARDLRIREIAEFYKIPHTTFDLINSTPKSDLLSSVDYSGFNELYPTRYKNYVQFLRENKLESNLEQKHIDATDFKVTYQDYSTAMSIEYGLMKENLDGNKIESPSCLLMCKRMIRKCITLIKKVLN